MNIFTAATVPVDLFRMVQIAGNMSLITASLLFKIAVWVWRNLILLARLLVEVHIVCI